MPELTRYNLLPSPHTLQPEYSSRDVIYQRCIFIAGTHYQLRLKIFINCYFCFQAIKYLHASLPYLLCETSFLPRLPSPHFIASP
jgi:hypothetical protein